MAMQTCMDTLRKWSKQIDLDQFAVDPSFVESKRIKCERPCIRFVF